MKIIQKSLLVSLVALSQFSLFAEIETEYPLAQIVLAHEKSFTPGISRKNAKDSVLFLIEYNDWGFRIAQRLDNASSSPKVQKMTKSWVQRQAYTDGVMSCRPVAYYNALAMEILMSPITYNQPYCRCTIARDDLEYYTDVIKDELEKSLINT